MTGIYQILAPDGKLYIGATKSIKRRIIEHKCRSKRDVHMPLYQSFKKHGFDSHQIKTLHELPKDVDSSVLDTYEDFYMRQYNECGIELLNDRIGGGNFGKLSEKQKDAISNTLKGRFCGSKNPNYGKTHSEDARRKMSDSKRGKISPNVGRKNTEEARRRMSESAKNWWAKNKK